MNESILKKIEWFIFTIAIASNGYFIRELIQSLQINTDIINNLKDDTHIRLAIIETKLQSIKENKKSCKMKE